MSDGQHAYGYFGRDYSTNMYSHQPFMCYECTNNYDASNTRYKDQATPSCGFAEDFNPKNPSIRRQVCYTYCLVIKIDPFLFKFLTYLAIKWCLLEKGSWYGRIKNRCWAQMRTDMSGIQRQYARGQLSSRSSLVLCGQLLQPGEQNPIEFSPLDIYFINWIHF